jgi:hypothetical protein
MSGEKQKGIWKKGIEKHCFPCCWKEKKRALSKCFYSKKKGESAMMLEEGKKEKEQKRRRRRSAFVVGVGRDVIE